MSFEVAVGGSAVPIEMLSAEDGLEKVIQSKVDRKNDEVS